MSNMAEYARIFETGTTDEWVEKRKSAVSDVTEWLAALSPQKAVCTASAIAASISNEARLPDEIAAVGGEMIQKYASSFVRSDDQGELQIKVVMSAAAINAVNDASEGGGWNTSDALAAAFWSALGFQCPLDQPKLEKLRQDLLVASRTHILRVANTARKRRPIPPIGRVNISQDSASGAKVNQAFSNAVEPMVTAMRDNAALDREELDFMWWLLSNRSELLDEPLANLSGPVHAVVAGFDAAAKLRKLPADSHRNIVLRNVTGGAPLSLDELVNELGERRTRLAASLGEPIQEAPAVFPLITAIATGTCPLPGAGQKLAASDWGARALLEGAIHHLHAGSMGGL